ncbi:MAG: serine hydrolase domain-containing protein [Longimicrobiales bacterium]|nr:serine hydrolase domain-containing protein [Longimicrobiales bacterium]
MTWLRLPLLVALVATPFASSSAAPLPTQEAQDSLAVAPPRSGPTDPAELEAFLDGVMRLQLDEHNTVGAVVTVVKDGQVFFTKGYGYSDWKARTPVDPERTLFRIGSISKLFVWTSVMQLVEDGVLDLDTDINEYLDGVEIPAAFDRPVTLRDILTHSAGFEDWVLELFGDEASDVRPLAEILSEQMPARVRPPGEVSSYSNHATGMAALIVEQAAGVPWDQFVRQRILAPLGMEHFSFAQPLPEALAPDMSKGYSGQSPDFEEKDFEFVPLYPIGAAAASGTTMARFMMAHLQLGRLGDARILEEETARQMQSDLFRMAPGVNAAAHGFYEMSANGERIIGHGGDTFWFHSQLALFPERNLGVFVSYNSQEGGAATGEFIEAFVDRYFPEEEVVPTPPEDFAERAERFTGRFRGNRFSHTTLAKLGALGSVSVDVTEDGTLRALDSEWVEVAPLTFDERYGNRTLVFREGVGGEITHFFLAAVPIVAFERVPWRENPMLHLALVVFAGIMIVGTVVAWPLGWLARRWYGVKAEDLVRIPTRARLFLWLTAVVFLVFFLGLAVVMGSDPEGIAVAVPTSLRVLLLLPLAGGGLTLVCLYCALVIQQQGFGRRLTRIAYSTTVLAFMLLLWQLNVWNALGWRL